MFAITPWQSAGAMEALRPSLKELSESVATLLQGQQEKAIAVGAFTGPARTPASSGPGIQKMLIEELEKLKILVAQDAKLEIKGDYRSILDDKSQLIALRLQAQVLDDKGTAVVTLTKKIDDRDLLAQVLGVTKPDLGSGLTPQKESELIRQRLEKPETNLHGSRIQADSKSKYAIELLVQDGKRQYVPVSASEVRGQAFIELKPGQVFGVRLLNDSEFDAAVELRIDGLSLFAFSEASGYQHVIVPKKSAALIKGWHRTNEVSDEFQIGDYSKSAVKELLASPDGIGTITASFAAAWDPKGEKPADEGSKFRDPFNPAVVRGKPVKAQFVEVVREFGRVRDVVAVRYNKPVE